MTWKVSTIQFVGAMINAALASINLGIYVGNVNAGAALFCFCGFILTLKEWRHD